MIQKIKPTKHLYKYQLREVASDTKDFETQKDSTFLHLFLFETPI